jgi:hypothetical protein
MRRLQDNISRYDVTRSYTQYGSQLSGHDAHVINHRQAAIAIDQLDHSLRIISYLLANQYNHSTLERIDHSVFIQLVYYASDGCPEEMIRRSSLHALLRIVRCWPRIRSLILQHSIAIRKLVMVHTHTSLTFVAILLAISLTYYIEFI